MAEDVCHRIGEEARFVVSCEPNVAVVKLLSRRTLYRR